MPSICIEGPDFVGKSTIAREFAFASLGVVTTTNEAALSEILQCFPDRTTTTGKRISEYLKSDKSDPLGFQCLHFANRLEASWSLHERADRASSRSQAFILDRYWPSGYAYGGADGVDKEWLLRCSLALKFQPELFVLLTADVKELARRMENSGRGGKERYDDPEMLERVQDNYLELWYRAQRERLCGSDWVIVKSAESPAETMAQVRSAIRAHFGPDRLLVR